LTPSRSEANRLLDHIMRSVLLLTGHGTTGPLTNMESGSENRAHWDEAAALEELERLQRGIEEWRRRRNDVQAEFERFVRGFRRTGQAAEIAGAEASERPRTTPPVNVPVSVPPSEPATPSAAASSSATPTASAPTPAATERVTPILASDGGLAPTPSAAPVSHGPSASPAAAAASRLNAWLAKQSTRRSRVIAGAGALVVLIVAGALLTRPWQNGPPDSSRSGSQSARASIPPLSQPAVPPTAQPAAAPADPGPPRSEIIALQRVWVRVVVDGNREVERELAAGERVALRAGTVSVIRAGNAGAVRVTINGENRGTLGPEGEPITRTLRAPGTPAR
jgi:hypothetical protein